MQNPMVGGLSKEKIALRRAMAMAHSPEKDIQILIFFHRPAHGFSGEERHQ